MARRKSDHQSKRRPRSGCSFLFATAGFACLMLLINGLLIMGLFMPLYDAITTRVGPEILRDQSYRERFLQGAMFVGPVVLLVIEWCILDRFTLSSARSRDQKQEKTDPMSTS